MRIVHVLNVRQIKKKQKQKKCFRYNSMEENDYFSGSIDTCSKCNKILVLNKTFVD
jgi:hypothetical protein